MFANWVGKLTMTSSGALVFFVTFTVMPVASGPEDAVPIATAVQAPLRVLLYSTRQEARVSLFMSRLNEKMQLDPWGDMCGDFVEES